MVVATKNNWIVFYLSMSRESRVELILGGNLFGYSLDKDETFKLLDYASGLHVVAIDTAGSYSSGLSETIIGDWLWDRGLQSSTKIMTKLEIDKGTTARFFKESLHRQFDASLSRLRSYSVETLLLHHFTSEPECLDTFLDFVEKKMEIGQIKRWGICNIAPKEFLFLVGRMVDRQMKEVTVQNYCNWARRDADYWSQFFALIDGKNINLTAVSYGIFGRGALVQGEKPNNDHDIFGKRRSLLNPLINHEKLDTRLQEILKLIRFMMLEEDNSLERFALSFVSQQRSNVLIGVRSIQQLNSILESLRNQINLALMKDIFLHISIPIAKLETTLGDPGIGN